MFLFALSGLFNDHIGDIIKTQWIQSATYQPTILSHSQIFVFSGASSIDFPLLLMLRNPSTTLRGCQFRIMYANSFTCVQGKATESISIIKNKYTTM